MRENELNRTAQIFGLLNHVVVVADEAMEKSLLNRVGEEKKTLTIFFLNAHAFNLAWDDEPFANALLGSDILLRDGIGMKVLFKCLGRDAAKNMNGTDFIPRLLLHLKGRRIALWGTHEPYLSIARDKLLADGHNIVSLANGFEDTDAYLAQLLDCAADVVVLGMGMPRQEILAEMLRKEAKEPVIIIAGGAIIDFISDRFARAPLIWRRCGLEWLFRLKQEPGRLAGRYLKGGLRFAGRAIYLTWKSRLG